MKFRYAEEALRGQGIGSKLLETAENKAKNRGCRDEKEDTACLARKETQNVYQYYLQP